jgi:hypothetical protein
VSDYASIFQSNLVCVYRCCILLVNCIIGDDWNLLVQCIRYSCSTSGMQALVEEGLVQTSRGVIVDGIEDLKLAIVTADKWLQEFGRDSVENPHLKDFRDLMKTANQLVIPPPWRAPLSFRWYRQRSL